MRLPLLFLFDPNEHVLREGIHSVFDQFCIKNACLTVTTVMRKIVASVTKRENSRLSVCKINTANAPAL